MLPESDKAVSRDLPLDWRLLLSSSLSPSSNFIFGSSNTVGEPVVALFDEGVKHNLLGLLDRTLVTKGFGSLGKRVGAVGIDDWLLIGVGPR